MAEGPSYFLFNFFIVLFGDYVSSYSSIYYPQYRFVSSFNFFCFLYTITPKTIKPTQIKGKIVANTYPVVFTF